MLVTLLAISLVGGWWWSTHRDSTLSIDTGEEVVAGETATPQVVVTSPLRAGDRWYCPNDFPIRVDDEGRYYPPHYPRFGEYAERPANCYADVQRVEALGHTLAAPPAATELVGGLYVMPASSPTGAACREMAAQVGFAVPCPTRLPAPGVGPSCADQTCVFDGRAFGVGIVIEQREFVAADDWCGSCDHHVFLTAARRRASPLARCGPRIPPPPTEAVRFHSCPSNAPWVPGVGGYPHEGHELALWRRDGVVYGVSIEGHGEDRRHVLRSVIDAIELVGP